MKLTEPAFIAVNLSMGNKKINAGIINSFFFSKVKQEKKKQTHTHNFELLIKATSYFIFIS